MRTGQMWADDDGKKSIDTNFNKVRTFNLGYPFARWRESFVVC